MREVLDGWDDRLCQQEKGELKAAVDLTIHDREFSYRIRSDVARVYFGYPVCLFLHTIKNSPDRRT